MCGTIVEKPRFEVKSRAKKREGGKKGSDIEAKAERAVSRARMKDKARLVLRHAERYPSGNVLRETEREGRRQRGKKERAKESRQPDRRIISGIRSKIWPVQYARAGHSRGPNLANLRAQGVEKKREREPRRARHVWNELLLLLCSTLVLFNSSEGCVYLALSLPSTSFSFSFLSVSPLVFLGRCICALRLLSTSSCYSFRFNFSQAHMLHFCQLLFL